MEPIDLAGGFRPILVCFSHLRWDFVYQRPQHLLSRAAKTYRVYFIEEPLYEVISHARMQISERGENLTVLTPILPKGEESRKLRLQQQLIDARFRGKRVNIVWFYTPLAQPLAQNLRSDLIIYDCMDELSAFLGAPPDLVKSEALLLKSADLVFTGGRSLFEAKRRFNPKTHLFPSSIDKAHFGKARMTSLDMRQDQARIPHPRLGFFGVIDERMDLDLLSGMADLRPDWHFIMIGPVVKIDPGTLPIRPNIHWLGAKNYQSLPEYIGAWDLGFMPFALNESTRFISPTKTPEFLAAGMPVISTPIKDVVTPYGDKGLVGISSSALEMVAKAEETMRQNRHSWLKKVDAFLADQSWDKTWAGMEQLIGKAGKRKQGIILQALALTPAAPKIISPFRSYDWLIVGAGYAGSVIAERLASQSNQRSLLIDRRPHIGGNAYDCRNKDSVLIHLYGPHIFHTNSDMVFSYLSQFTEWRPYEHRVLASVDGKLVPIPINLDTINILYGLSLTSEELSEFLARRAEKLAEIRTSEDVVVSQVGRELYEKFFQHYTRKQWGMDPCELDKSVTARIPVRVNRDDRYFSDKYQYMPRDGYTALFEKMLDHPNIEIRLGVDYREIAATVHYERMVYTGPIDEYFNYCFGKLPYRSLSFDHVTIDKEWHQPVAVVNYPQDRLYTRVTEYKHLTGQIHPKTSLTYEYPRAEGDPYYPIPRPENAKRYQLYRDLADKTPGVIFIGRLASYKYYNMDQVVAQALSTYSRLAPNPPRKSIASRSAKIVTRRTEKPASSTLRKAREAAKP